MASLPILSEQPRIICWFWVMNTFYANIHLIDLHHCTNYLKLPWKELLASTSCQKTSSSIPSCMPAANKANLSMTSRCLLMDCPTPILSRSSFKTAVWGPSIARSGLSTTQETATYVQTSKKPEVYMISMTAILSKDKKQAYINSDFYPQYKTIDWHKEI